MHLESLSVRNFRNHSHTTIDCGRGINFLLGNNGQGKTNLVEAVSYLCLTKSFYAGSDALVLKFGEGMFEVEGTLVSDDGRPSEVRVAYLAESNEKVYMVNRRRIEPLSSAVGRFPIVVFSPEHGAITSGGPAERRKFLDLVMSQADPVYFRSLLDYRTVLRQRNRALLDLKLNRGGDQATIAALEAWDEQLIRHGSVIWAKRGAFVAAFAPMVRASYSCFVDEGEEPAIGYRPLGEVDLPGELPAVEAAFRSRLRRKEGLERRFGTSLTGPHRDELSFAIDGRELRSFASQGQHKTFVIALKLAEFLYLRERRAETPLLLLDDVFAELDPARTARAIAAVEEIGQAFLTSTDRRLVEAWSPAREDCRWFLIENGAVADRQALHHA